MNPKHEVFLTEVVRHGDANRAYQAAYPEASGESLRVAANRLLHTPEIANAINALHGEARSHIEKEMAAFLLLQVEDIREKRRIMRSIYTKTMESTNADIFKAIQIDNQLAEKEMKLLSCEPVFALETSNFAEATADEEETEGSTDILQNVTPPMAGQARPNGSSGQATEQSPADGGVSTDEKTSINVTNRNNFKHSAHEHEYENKNQANNLPHRDASGDFSPDSYRDEMTDTFCAENVTDRNNAPKTKTEGIKQNHLMNRLKHRQEKAMPV